MTVNATDIYNQTSIWKSVGVLNSETGYLFSIVVILIIAMIAFYRGSQYGASRGFIYASLYGFLISLPLWIMDWVPFAAPLICISLLAFTLLIQRLTEE